MSRRSSLRSLFFEVLLSDDDGPEPDFFRGGGTGGRRDIGGFGRPPPIRDPLGRGVRSPNRRSRRPPRPHPLYLHYAYDPVSSCAGGGRGGRGGGPGGSEWLDRPTERVHGPLPRPAPPPLTYGPAPPPPAPYGYPRRGIPPPRGFRSAVVPPRRRLRSRQFYPSPRLPLPLSLFVHSTDTRNSPVRRSGRYEGRGVVSLEDSVFCFRLNLDPSTSSNFVRTVRKRVTGDLGSWLPWARSPRIPLSPPRSPRPRPRPGPPHKELRDPT